jgi:hypothetical protein
LNTKKNEIWYWKSRSWLGDRHTKVTGLNHLIVNENKLITDDLNFKPVSSDFVSKQINKLNIKKATGYDGISPKILKLSMPCIVEP